MYIDFVESKEAVQENPKRQHVPKLNLSDINAITPTDLCDVDSIENAKKGRKVINFYHKYY